MNEDRLQAECYIWFHNTFPELRGTLCYNLNNSANKIQGNKNKAMGLQKGRSDFTFYHKSKAHMIEMKTPTGKQFEDQRTWQRQIIKQGFDYHIIKSKEEFQKLIKFIVC